MYHLRDRKGEKMFLIVPFLNEEQLIRGFTCEKFLMIRSTGVSGDELQHQITAEYGFIILFIILKLFYFTMRC